MGEGGCISGLDRCNQGSLLGGRHGNVQGLGQDLHLPGIVDGEGLREGVEEGEGGGAAIEKGLLLLVKLLWGVGGGEGGSCDVRERRGMLE